MTLPTARATCAKTAHVMKYGAPYKLICQRDRGHDGRCRDVDNDIWFEPGSST